MSLLALNRRSLAKRAEAASNSRTMKILDWATAFAFAGYAAYLLYGEWPNPSYLSMATAFLSVVGFALAIFDWKPRVRAFVESRLRNRFIRRRG